MGSEQHWPRLRDPAIFVAGVMMGAALMLLPAMAFGGRQPMPIVFDEPLAAAVPSFGCPGDRLSYSYSIHILAPAMVRLNTTITKAGGVDHVIVATQDKTRIFNLAASGIVSDTVRFEVPDLPPGSYERIVGISRMDMGAPPSFLRIPFGVREGCP